MDLAVILPLSALLALQLLGSLLLLSPRAISKHVASLLHLTRTSSAVSSVMYTVAVAVGAMTISSIVQLVGVNKSLDAQLAGDRAMALTAEQLRALLAVVLGVSNLALLFLNKALAYEQQTADKATLNLSVLQKQAKGLQTEYMRATSSKDEGSGAAPDSSSGKQEVSQLQEALEVARAEAKAAATNEAAVKSQAKGLEREYDRLMSEVDELKRRLARYDGQYAAAGDKKSC
jgi:phage shock protein A